MDKRIFVEKKADFRVKSDSLDFVLATPEEAALYKAQQV